MALGVYDMMMDGKKRAIVVGASSGIGREVAILLANRGWTVGVAARRLQNLEELASCHEAIVDFETIDVTVADADVALVRLIERMGGIDLLFYASGVGHQNRTLTPDIEMHTVETNAMGFTRVVGACYCYMVQQGHGHIAVISSIAGTKGLGPAPSYSATKAFQNCYIQALEQQAHSRGLNIRFTDLRPGFVDTALLNDGNHYPMLLSPTLVAREMVRAIECKRRVRVIDWRWRIVTALWRRVPRCLWRYFKL